MALSVLGLLANYKDAPVWIAEDATTARILHEGESWTIEGAESKTFSIIGIAFKHAEFGATMSKMEFQFVQ